MDRRHWLSRLGFYRSVPSSATGDSSEASSMTEIVRNRNATFPKIKAPRATVLCLTLHVLLVFMHFALLFILVRRYDHLITMPIDTFTTTWAPLIVGTTLQAFATVYTAVLVLLTQRLALRRDLNTPQTLTALHDKSSAWLGVGSALVSLWQQTKLRVATGGVLSITLYLLGVFTVHISIPSTLHLQLYNATAPVQYPTQLARANFTANLVSAYDVLLVYGQIQKVGVLENMVYDIVPEVPNSVGNTTVNASIYDVDCMALPASTTPFGTFVNITGALASSIQIDSNTTVTFALPYYPGIYAGTPNEYIAEDCSSAGPIQADGACWFPIFMASTVPIIDSTSQETPWPENPWVGIGSTVLQTTGLPPTVSMSGLQIVACALHVTDSHIPIDATPRQPFSAPDSPSSAVWRNAPWPDKKISYDRLILDALFVANASPQSGHQMAATLRVTDINSTASPSAPTFLDQSYFPLAAAVSQSPTAFDVFLQEELGLATQGRPNITLSKLNKSIAKALAAVHWYGQQLNYSDPHASSEEITVFGSTNPSIQQQEQPLPVVGTGQATIMVVQPRYRANLNLIAIIFGLVSSTMMLLLATVLLAIPSSVRTHSASTTVDSAGILQITWLLGHEPHLAEVEKPELEALRAAGMFEAQMREHEREKADWEHVAEVYHA
ncbi:hypothetical protein PsYK624_042640 [Phanerochaete sordida]|uniref:Uncharacterized protein n=1 Tax=Phanerochaete sordida TaxID=48140 RepID=A0A9P3LAA3_9APHY|nr:hypothetical protein PsYK624_042640 [Phanerochaete sordida]